MDEKKNTDKSRTQAEPENEKRASMRRMLLWGMLLLVIGVLAFLAVGVIRSLHGGGGGKGGTVTKKALPDKDIKPVVRQDFDLPGGVGMAMVLVKPGSFEMSRKDNSNWGNENPHNVKLENEFYICMTEVTQAQWKAVMGSRENGDEGGKKMNSNFRGDNRPVEMVSWDEAMAFCAKLNELGIAPGGWMFTLPTETQWEFAAAGGVETRKCKYSGSDNLDEVGWYGDSGKAKDKDMETAEKGKGETHPVADKKPNELGIYDMSGNVWEWTLDDFCGDSSKTKAEERTVIRGTSGGKAVYCQYRTVRGGSWSKGDRYCRVAARSYYGANQRFNFIGFRVALVKMTPTDVAQMAIGALKRGDFDAVVASSHGKAQTELKKYAAKFAELKKAAAAGDEAQKAQLAQVQGILDRISLEIKGGDTDEDLATFEVERTLDGKTNTDKMYLKKINGVWKIVDESEFAPAK